MKKLLVLFAVALIVSCQSETLEVKKTVLDKDGLSKVLATNTDFNQLNQIDAQAREAAIKNISNLDQNDINLLAAIITKYSGTEILNATDSEKKFLNRIYSVNTKSNELVDKILSDLKVSYEFNTKDFYELSLSSFSSSASGRESQIDCHEVEVAVRYAVFGECNFNDGAGLGACVAKAYNAGQYAFIGCIAKEIGMMPW